LRLLQNVIRQRKRSLRQLQASRRAILGHRMGTSGNEKINFGEDVFESLQARSVNWHTPMFKQGETKSKR
jgi:hypothetical protein